MGQGGKGWRRCQACRSEPPKARGRHRSFEIYLSLSLSLPVSVFRPPFSSLLALARAVSVTPRSLFVPSFRAAFSVGPSLVSLSVNLRTGWWDGRDGRGGREGRREVRLGGQRVPVHGTRSVLVALIGGSFVPMFETGFRTPRLCIRRKYGFVRTRGARGCMNPSSPHPFDRPPIHPRHTAAAARAWGLEVDIQPHRLTLSVILRTPSNLPTGFPSVSPRFIPRYPSQCTRPLVRFDFSTLNDGVRGGEGRGRDLGRSRG